MKLHVVKLVILSNNLIIHGWIYTNSRNQNSIYARFLKRFLFRCEESNQNLTFLKLVQCSE